MRTTIAIVMLIGVSLAGCQKAGPAVIDQSSPQATVKSFFSAINSSTPEAVKELCKFGAGSPLDDEAAFKGFLKRWQAMKHVEVGGAQMLPDPNPQKPGPRRASVGIKYEFDGRAHNAPVTVVESDGKWYWTDF